MTKTEFPEGFFEKPRPHATNLYIAMEHEIEDGGYIEPIKKLILCMNCKAYDSERGICKRNNMIAVRRDDYCSRAERKKDNGKH